MKIYTKSGDHGKTSLFSGERVSKSHRQIDAYGDIDELNSMIGAIVACLPSGQSDLTGEIHQIQSDLFQIGAWLATVPDSPMLAELTPLTADQCRFLEIAMDRMAAELPALTSFILPGGHVSAAWSHVARTVCRRAERRVVHLAEIQSADPVPIEMQAILTYLNRLSDYLFMLARYGNHLAGISDIHWGA